MLKRKNAVKETRSRWTQRRSISASPATGIATADWTEDRRSKATASIARLEQRLTNSPWLTLNLSDVANLLHLERTYCCKMFRTLTGTSLTRWMRAIRIANAARLLHSTTHSIAEVSRAVGYIDVTTFERNFRREKGLSPSSFRRLAGSAREFGKP
jgi:AraC-like DNA-binding protein